MAILCPFFGTRGGCQRGRFCLMVYQGPPNVAHPTGMWPTRQARLRPWPGNTVMLREHIALYVQLPVPAWTAHFRPRGQLALPQEVMARITRFLRGPPRCISDARPCTVLRTRLETRPPTADAGRDTSTHTRLRVECLGREPHHSCWPALLQGYLDWEFAPHRMFNSARADMPVDATGALELHHCTDVASGLRILRTGGMQYGPRQHSPSGVYMAREPASFYDLGCHVVLRAPGVVLSKAVSRGLQQPGVFVPIGAIAVLERSVQEWICHPKGCQVLRMYFHYAALRAFLGQSPLAQRMQIPDIA